MTTKALSRGRWRHRIRFFRGFSFRGCHVDLFAYLKLPLFDLLHDLFKGYRTVIKRYRNGGCGGVHLEIEDAFCLLQDRTYPGPARSSPAARDFQTIGLFGGKGYLRKKQNHCAEEYPDTMFFHLLQIFHVLKYFQLSLADHVRLCTLEP